MTEKLKKPLSLQSVKSKNLITSCEFASKACSCTTLNGNSCKKKQERGDCLEKQTNKTIVP